jgi:NAD(P)H-hydrate epimerase
MNRSGIPIVAVDMPSGLDGDTGAPQGRAVRAACTVTFGLPKQGCFLGQGPAHVGTLLVEPITFPPQLLEDA